MDDVGIAFGGMRDEMGDRCGREEYSDPDKQAVALAYLAGEPLRPEQRQN